MVVIFKHNQKRRRKSRYISLRKLGSWIGPCYRQTHPFCFYGVFLLIPAFGNSEACEAGRRSLGALHRSHGDYVFARTLNNVLTRSSSLRRRNRLMTTLSPMRLRSTLRSIMVDDDGVMIVGRWSEPMSPAAWVLLETLGLPCLGEWAAD